MNGDFQGDGAVATVDVLVGMNQREGADVVNHSVETMRGERNGDASVSLVGKGVGGMDGDLQVHGTVAAKRGLFLLSVGERPGYVSGNRKSIFVIGLELASGVGKIRDDVWVNDEMQNGGAVAAVHVGVGVRCEGRHLRILNVEVITMVIHANASLCLYGVAFFWLDGQKQCDNTVAMKHCG